MSIAIAISTQILHDFLGEFHYPRRSLLHTPPNSQTQQNPENDSKTFDGNSLITVLSALFCALIFSLVLGSIIKCALRCTGSSPSESGTGDTSARLANRGVKRKALKTFPVINYTVDSELPGLDSECVICLSDFAPGDWLRLLPKCNHGFHARCIDKWLGSHSSCPKCRDCLIETCQKIVGCSQASSSEPVQSRQDQTIVTIAPVGPEGLIHSYRF